jgi:hypothetical protein
VKKSGQHVVLPLSYLLPTQRCEFEDMFVFCPAQPELVLAVQFGENWRTWQPPPKPAND